MNEPVIPEKRKEGLRVSVKELAFVLAVLLLGLFFGYQAGHFDGQREGVLIGSQMINVAPGPALHPEARCEAVLKDGVVSAINCEPIGVSQ